MSENTFGPLDLSEADTRGFPAIDPGSYNAEVIKLDWDATTNPGGNLPLGTPMLRIQFRVFEPKIDGEVIDQDRRVFTQYFNPGTDYDARKRSTMLGMLARFFMAMGYEESEIKSSSFNPNFQDLEGQKCVVTVGKEPKKINGVVQTDEFNNPVKGVKPAGSLDAVEAASGLL